MIALERRYSKTKANANNIVWTGNEVIPVTMYVGGLIYDALEFGNLRITGRAMYCSGYRIDFQRPSGDRAVTISTAICTGLGEVVSGTEMTIVGTQIGQEKVLTAGMVMPEGSIWFIRVTADGREEYFPESATVTYWLRYANGPVISGMWSPVLSEGGIGFWEIGHDFKVEETPGGITT